MIESTYEDNGSALIVALENVFKWGLASWQILLSYSSVAVRKTFQFALQQWHNQRGWGGSQILLRTIASTMKMS